MSLDLRFEAPNCFVSPLCPVIQLKIGKQRKNEVKWFAHRFQRKWHSFRPFSEVTTNKFSDKMALFFHNQWWLRHTSSWTPFQLTSYQHAQSTSIYKEVHVHVRALVDPGVGPAPYTTEDGITEEPWRAFNFFKGYLATWAWSIHANWNQKVVWSQLSWMKTLSQWKRIPLYFKKIL